MRRLEYLELGCPLTGFEKKRLSKIWRKPEKAAVPMPNRPLEYILEAGKEEIMIWRFEGVAVYGQERLVFTLTPDACKVLDNPIIRLETLIASKYGELIPWDEVQKYFPIFSTAAIVDCETGKSFNVQRRGGKNHADCQPLTKEDTRIMKQIYHGRFSWDRRAVIVVVAGKRIAASMAGQPHGAGAISGNEFPGHFCVHFLGSTLHNSNRVDPAHKNMILKAAGKN